MDEHFEGDLITPYVKDIPGLFAWFGVEFKPEDWRYFIDSNKDCTKCCILPNIQESSIYYGEEFPVIPLLISTSLKEDYESISKVMALTNYYSYDFLICCDLKLVNVLCGLGPAQSAFCCFLCNFRSTQDEYLNHYTTTYELREDYRPGDKTTLRESLVNKKNIILPPLHIMLGLYSSFIKSVQNNEDLFEYLQSLMPHVSKAKHIDGILVGPDVRKLISDQTFYNFLDDEQAAAWESFVIFCNDFLCSSNRPVNYRELADNLKVSFGHLKKNMSLKVHLATQHIEYFRTNCSMYSEQQGERFHQDFKRIIERFKHVGFGKTSLADYLWLLKRESSNLGGRKDQRQKFLVKK